MELKLLKSVGLATTLCLSLVLGLTACTKEIVTEKVVEVEAKTKAEDGTDIRIEVNDKMDSEQLALAGEQLVSPATFMLAQKAFDMSLSKDKNNKRALFYTAMLKPYIALRGLGTRIKPMLRLHGNIAHHEHQLTKIPNSPFRDFILDGSEDIKTVADAQSYLMELQKAWNETRLFLLKNSDLSLTLNLNPYTFKEHIEGALADTCSAWQTNDGNGFDITCSYKGIAQKKINSADIIALRQMTAGMVMTFTMYTTYSLSGLDELVVLDREGKMTDEQRMRFIEDNLPEVGKLRKDHQLKQFIDLGSDLVSAMNWAVKYQSQLCPKGYSETQQRPGFLFSQGFCAKDINQAKKEISKLEQILKGAIEEFVPVDNRNIVELTKIDYLAWARNPIEDLRSVAPMTYNRCGRAASLKDKTFGGVFPNGDAEKFLLTSCK